jgi:hypothetical protein
MIVLKILGVLVLTVVGNIAIAIAVEIAVQLSSRRLAARVEKIIRAASAAAPVVMALVIVIRR